MTRIPYATDDQFEELTRHARPPEDATSINSLRMLAHTPAIGSAVLRLIYTILTKADIDLGLRELVILRVAQHCRASYVRIQHTELARAVGVTDAQIAALERGDMPADLFSKRERAVLELTDEVLRGPQVSDRVFGELRDELTSSEVVELLLTIGYFRMIGGLLTTLDVELDTPCASELLALSCKVAGDI